MCAASARRPRRPATAARSPRPDAGRSPEGRQREIGRSRLTRGKRRAAGRSRRATRDCRPRSRVRRRMPTPRRSSACGRAPSPTGPARPRRWANIDRATGCGALRAGMGCWRDPVHGQRQSTAARTRVRAPPRHKNREQAAQQTRLRAWTLATETSASLASRITPTPGDSGSRR